MEHNGGAVRSMWPPRKRARIDDVERCQYPTGVRMSNDQDNTVDRRRLLRRAGTVAAGLAGTGVVGAAAATSAEAAPGDPSSTSNHIVPVIPQRVVDTRVPQGRTNIVNLDGEWDTSNLDSAGRVLGGRTIDVILARYAFMSEAIFGTVTVTGPVAASFLQIFPTGIARPTNFSTINFEANQTLSNGLVSAVNWDNDRFSIYAGRTTHVIIDVVAFLIGSGQVYPQILLTHDGWPTGAADQAQAARQRRPIWEQDD
ncbi:hypothetical protein ACTWLT_06900 [Micromonospora sp. ZYX-F-536]